MLFRSVLKEGEVKNNDELNLISSNKTLSIKEVFSLFSSNKKDVQLAQKAVNCSSLAESCKESIQTIFHLK